MTKGRMVDAALAVVLVVMLAVSVMSTASGATGDGVLATCWILVGPDSSLNVRSRPWVGSEVTGWLYCGDEVSVDEMTDDGWAHLIGLSTEAGQGWVSGLYLSTEPVVVNTRWCIVEANGRVAVRKTSGGKRTSWMQPGDRIYCLADADEWTLTTKGYIKSEYLREEDSPDASD